MHYHIKDYLFDDIYFYKLIFTKDHPHKHSEEITKTSGKKTDIKCASTELLHDDAYIRFL